MSIYNTNNTPNFYNGIRYFIEHKETRKWLSVDSLEGYVAAFAIELPIKEYIYTNDPYKAISYTNSNTATDWAYYQSILNDHEITEHLFCNLEL